MSVRPMGKNGRVRLARDLYKTCTRLVRDLYETCTRLVRDLPARTPAPTPRDVRPTERWYDRPWVPTQSDPAHRKWACVRAAKNQVWRVCGKVWETRGPTWYMILKDLSHTWYPNSSRISKTWLATLTTASTAPLSSFTEEALTLHLHRTATERRRLLVESAENNRAREDKGERV